MLEGLFKKRTREALLQKRIGYSFKNGALLSEALTHPSFTCEHPEARDYQRLEFLGDSALELIVSEWLFFQYPQAQEGELTAARSALTSRLALAALAKKMDLGSCIICSLAEKPGRLSILENAFESLIGAIFCDSDYKTVQRWLKKQIGALPKTIQELIAPLNPKGRLQEYCQAHGLSHTYSLISADGPDHAKRYTAGVHIEGQLKGQGCGSSKKEAQEAAAKEFLCTLGGAT